MVVVRLVRRAQRVCRFNLKNVVTIQFMAPFETSPGSIGAFDAHVVDPQATKEIVHRVRELVAALSPRGKFPGPNPCSLERANLKTLVPGTNWLCEKTDGTRALLVFIDFRGVKCAFLVTRAWDVFSVGLRNVPRALFQGTVLDGELVLSKTWSWLGFDAMLVSGVSVWASPLGARLDAARRGLAAYAPDPSDAMHIEFKTYYRDFGEYRAHLARAERPVDGTIVTPDAMPVCVGRHPTLYKLKEGKHTVDFVFRPPHILAVYDAAARGMVPVATLSDPDPTLVPDCIVEASWRGGPDETKNWVLETVRTDKTQSNDRLTFTKTLLNYREKMTLGDLELHWNQS